MMNLTNIINDTDSINMSPEFNSCQLNLENKNPNIEWENQGQNICDCEYKNKRNILLKQMFSLLAQQQPINVVNHLFQKYGDFFDQKLRTLCLQVGDLIGNYFITCRYNDDLGKKNKNFVKYVIMCDCDDDNCETEQNINGGSVDGFFGNNVKNFSKVRMCKKHNLPVLANIQELSYQDFTQLAKKVSQVKDIPKKDVQQGTNQQKRVIGKIAKVFKNIKPKKVQAKIDTQSFKLKDANTQIKANLDKKFVSQDVSDVKKPEGEKMSYKISKEMKQANVNLPVNSISVSVKSKKTSMNPFTIRQQKIDDVKVSNLQKSNVNIPSKNIEIAVEKQSKFVDNISLYTEPVKTQFDLAENYDFDLNQQNEDNIQIDPKGNFDF